MLWLTPRSELSNDVENNRNLPYDISLHHLQRSAIQWIIEIVVDVDQQIYQYYVLIGVDLETKLVVMRMYIRKKNDQRDQILRVGIS